MRTAAESSERLDLVEGLFDALDFPTALIGAAGQYRVINRAYGALLDVEAASLLECPFAHSVHPDQRADCVDIMAQLFNGASAHACFESALGVNGRSVPARLSLSPLRLTNEESRAIVATAVRRGDADTAPETPPLPTVAHVVDAETLAHMGHELRTPLNAILGFSEAMRTEMFGPLGNERYREYADDVHRSGQRLLTVVSALLGVPR